ncbi:MAG: alpha/beta hydrolase [Microthrixaceae bacterium]
MTPRALALLVTVAVLGGCSGGSVRAGDEPGDVVTGPPSADSGFPASWSPEPLDWTDCPSGGSDSQCATLEVPLDWSEPEGATIELALARVPSEGEPIGSLLVNPGGPGASGIDYLGAFAPTSDLGVNFDLVSWDPRGVGSSTALDCDEHVAALYAADPSPDDADEAAELEDAAGTVARDCSGEPPELLENLYTEQVARDLEAIRMALGDDKLNYLGFSYGTHIGQTYAELFGDRIRAMTLDGVVDPSQGFEEFLIAQAEAFEASFTAQADACAAAGTRRCGVADLQAALDEVLAAAEQDPIPAGSGGMVGPSEVLLAALYVGYVSDGWSILGPALDEADRGDGEALAELAAGYTDLSPYGPYAAVVCTDSPHPRGGAEYRAFTERAMEAAPRFGATIASEMLPCATWPVPPQGEPSAATAQDAPPILVVGNTGDPATPLANAEAVAESLRSAVLVVVRSDGHTAYGTNSCATELIDAYFERLDVPAEGTRC